jgi:hypothetical protein
MPPLHRPATTRLQRRNVDLVERVTILTTITSLVFAVRLKMMVADPSGTPALRGSHRPDGRSAGARFGVAAEAFAQHGVTSWRRSGARSMHRAHL